MPRRARIDYQGALHHVIIRGINRNPIFIDDRDRERFLDRLVLGLDETGLDLYAWALIPNHAHFLFETRGSPLASLMRRLLTGYAIYFNLRHGRTGHLFQNRYKSILCQKEAYFLQLVRYIHLNPLRAGLVPDIQRLNSFQWCGHGAIIGLNDNPWQNTAEVLSHFGSRAHRSRQRYHQFIIKGIPYGRRPELTGGGLVRSAGGWHGLLELRKQGDRIWGDERILGDNDFVRRVLTSERDRLTRKEQRTREGWTLQRLLNHVAGDFGVKSSDLKSRKRTSEISRARSFFAWWASDELGFGLTEIARFLECSVPAISKAVTRGEELLKHHRKPSPFDQPKLVNK